MAQAVAHDKWRSEPWAPDRHPIQDHRECEKGPFGERKVGCGSQRHREEGSVQDKTRAIHCRTAE